MRRLLAILAALGLPVLALGQAPTLRSYTVTWTAEADPGKVLTGKGTVVVWTYRALLPNGRPPPLPQTKVYALKQPRECAGRQRCTLATYPLPDPSILARVIVSGNEAGSGQGADLPFQVAARVTSYKPPGTY